MKRDSFRKDVVKNPKLAELEAARCRIIEALVDYERALRLLGDSEVVSLNTVKEHTTFYDKGEVKTDAILKEVDKDLWELAISSSGIGTVLSSDGETKLRAKYRDNPPPFVATEAEAVLDRLAQNTGALAASTVKAVFDKLVSTYFRRGNSWRGDKENRSHDRIRKSFRFSHFHGGMIDKYGFKSHYRQETYDLFNDLEMICRMVNHAPKLLWPNRLGDRIYQARPTEAGTFPWVFANDYFRVQIYKCGNLRIEFLDAKTLELINRYGSDGKSLIDPFGASKEK